jgi:hypothetical protein
MPTPKAICIEDLAGARSQPRYTQCVALPGNEKGLALDEQGHLVWKNERSEACQIWISADDRLILYRLPDAPPVEVSRAGRSVMAPVKNPVVLLDGDEIAIGGRRLRVHIHGQCSKGRPPAPVAPMRPAGSERGRGRAATAALVLGAAVAAGGCPHPPEPNDPSRKQETSGVARTDARPPGPRAEWNDAPDGQVFGPTGEEQPRKKSKGKKTEKKDRKDIEVRRNPPIPIAP